MPPALRRFAWWVVRALTISSCVYYHLDPAVRAAVQPLPTARPARRRDAAVAVEDDPGWLRYAWSGG
ncbi:hypothetical protein LWF15_19265 [Kineosporia rhizophila]|uniref:hypothetical protein n=1 Tax=Kineosporia TaxID=49184 RepID=UPI001E29FD22|nr:MULTISPECIES: hypothetical protein [Kineosporia]MCE0537633.1 hypothetical protein [Kineosporia rhizophila]GLY18852.1 hypothetical protein Kisp01_58660 [Kineosporia sp. NBRC 101677]